MIYRITILSLAIGMTDDIHGDRFDYLSQANGKVSY